MRLWPAPCVLRSGRVVFAAVVRRLRVSGPAGSHIAANAVAGTKSADVLGGDSQAFPFKMCDQFARGVARLRMAQNVEEELQLPPIRRSD